MSARPLNLPLGVTEYDVKVHPVVLFTICDAFIRRNEDQDRVIGTLLGTVADGTIDIRSCYAVPHSDKDDEVSLDVQQHQTMAKLHTKVNSREKVVGWFSTGSQVRGSDSLYQDFYGKEIPNPVHLTLDTSLQDGHMGVRAYVSKTLSIGGKELAREFQEVHCEVNRIEAEKAAGDLLTAQTVDKLPGDLEGLTTSLDKLEATLAAAKAYVDAVIAGQQQQQQHNGGGGNNNNNNNVAVGRALSEAVAAVPHFSTEEFQRLIKDSQNDVVLTLYLGNLIKAHISLADRLGTMQLPLL